MKTTELFFIDSRVPEREAILKQLPINSYWHLIDENSDGLFELVDVAIKYTNIHAIHILSHGDAGKLYLGAVATDLAELKKNRSGLNLLNSKLAKHADIFLYGCKVASGEIGQNFIDSLSTYAGAAVHASTNNIGSVSLGGNWKLDVSTSPAHHVFFEPQYEVEFLLSNTSPTFFAGNGTAETGSRIIYSSEVLLQSGKILTASIQPSYDQRVAYLYKISADGVYDLGFTSNIITSGSPGLRVSDIVVQADGKILISGTMYSGPDMNSYVVRRNADGSIDNTFGASYYARVIFGFDTTSTTYNTNDYANALGLNDDGTIIVAGRTTSRKGLNGLDWEDSKFSITKLNSSGSVVLKVSENITSGYDSADSISMLGMVLVAGITSYSFSVIKYKGDLTRDSSFGVGGVVTSDITSIYEPIGMSIDNDGKIIIYGYSNNQGFLVRYNSNGTLDTGFSNDGKLFINNFSIKEVNFEASGKLLVRGSGAEFDSIRYNNNGSTDYSYGETSSSTLNSNVTYTEGGGGVVLDGEVRIFDAELYSFGSYSGSTISLFRKNGANSDDKFSSSYIHNLLNEDAPVVVGNIQIGSAVLNSEGTLSITFNGNSSQELINQFLSSITYQNISDAPPASLEIAWQFTDGDSVSPLSVTGFSTVNISSVNDSPTGGVTISGTAMQGQTLTASNTLSDADGIPASGTGSISYQWKADGVAISGATMSSYTLGQGQVGKAISVTANYTDSQGTAETMSSSATGTVGNVNDTPSGAVTITGTAMQGQTLTASNTLSDADGIPASGTGSISYQWKADGVAISGATMSSYTLGQGQVGKAISVTANYTDSQGTAETMSSSATGTVGNVNDTPSGAVTITGTAMQGQTLTASNTLSDADGIPASGTGSISYQWKADGVAISGATMSSYTLGQGQVGKAISVTANYTDSQGTAETMSSSATGTVGNVNDTPSGAVTITGTAMQGQTLTASNTLSDADGIPASGTGSISYQWKADGVAISGATMSSYTLGQGQVGKAISVTANYTDSQGTAETMSSSATGTVGNVNDTPSGAVTITGTAMQGQTLTASNTLSDADGIPASGTGSISYQWKADGVAISGATMSSYTLGQGQVGKAITVAASYFDAQGSLEVVNSSSTSLVSNVDDAATGAIAIVGSGQVVGGTLTARVSGVTDLDGTITSVSYQWQENIGTTNNPSWISIGTVGNASLSISDVGFAGKLVRALVVTTDSQGGITEFISSTRTLLSYNSSGDGGVAPVSMTIAQVFDDGVAESDGYGLYKTSSGSYVVDSEGLSTGGGTDSPVTLKVGAKGFVPKVAPSALLAYDDGTFGVVAGSGAAWTEQKFTAEGLASGAALKLTLSDVLAKETFFNEDINSDGGIGDTIAQIFDDGVAESDGYGLYKTSSGSYVVDSEGLSTGGGTDSPVTLKVGAKGFVPKVAPSALLAYDDGTFGVVAGSGAAWTEQKFTAEGLASGAALKLTLSDVLAKETFFNEDINSDGGIGDTIAQIFDDGVAESDGYGLYKTSSGSYVVDSEGLSTGGGTDSPVTLKVGAKGFVPKVAPSALLAYDDGTFGVVAGSGAAWTEQKFTAEGLASGAALKLTLSDVLAKETFFNEDINGGGIGDTIAQVFDWDGYADSASPYGLYKTASGSYVLDEADKGYGDGISQDSMRVLAGVKNWAPKGTIVGIAEKYSGYVEVLLRSGAAYTTQKIDPNSGQLAGPAAKLAVAQLAAREYYYEMDLNGNGQVELVGLATPPADWGL